MTAAGSGAAGARGPACSAALAAAVALLALLHLVPTAPSMPEPGIDTSWELVLHEAAARGWTSGRDLAFTHGPLGLLNAPVFHPETFGRLLAGRAALALAFAAGLLASAAPLRRRPLAHLGWSFAVLAVAGHSGDVFFFALLAVFLLVETADPPAPAAIRLALRVAAAAAALVKLTWAVALAALLLVLAARAVARRRPDGAVPVVLGSVAGLGAAAGLDVPAASAFLRDGAAILAGHDAAMSLPPSAAAAVAFAAAAAGSVAFAARAERRRHAGLPFAAAGLAVLAFVAFKQGFGRFDVKHGVTSLAMLVVLLLLQAGAAAGREPGRRAAGGAVLLGLALLLAGAVWVGAHARIGPELATRPVERPLRALGALADLRGHLAALPLRREAALAAIRAAHPVPPAGDATADLLPIEASVAIAHGLRYRPRPVFQSYLAFAPRLLARNAAHFSGPEAPAAVLLAVDPIDGRWPALDDSLSWPALLGGYEPAGIEGAYALLRRSPEPRRLRLRALGEAWPAWGETAAVPEAGAVWATVRVEPSLLGQIAALAFQTPRVHLEAEIGGGPRVHRLVPGIARAGFLLSPYVARPADFVALSAALAGGGGAGAGGPTVRALRIVTDGPAWHWRPEIEVRFHALEPAAP